MSFTPSIGLFRNFRDAEGNDVGSRPIPLYVNAHLLAANTAESDTVPAGANMVIISADVDIYVNCNGTATVTTDTTDGSASELNPSSYCFNTTSTTTAISIIAAAVGHVTLAYYRV